MPRKHGKPAEDPCGQATCPVMHGRATVRPPGGCACGGSVELAAILASTLDPLVSIDSFGTILSASNSVERVFGWKPTELIGKNVHVLMPEPHHTRHDRYLATYRETLKTNILGRTREFDAVRKDGTLFPIELSVARADVPGQPLPLFVGVIKDISERKSVERQLEEHRTRLQDLVHERTRELEESHDSLRLADRLAAIGTLAAGLGHDMNNVLLPVRARMNALGALNLPKAAIQHLGEMRKSCAYLQQLSDGLHMLALNPEEGDLADATTDLHEWWKMVGSLLTKALPKGVKFESEVPVGVPRVPVASHKLTQAVLNLVVNAGEAIQSMRKRPRAARVGLWAHADLGKSGRQERVRLGVADNGPGMTPQVKARVFDAFFTTKTRGLGTGLGLSLVRSVVLGAGGEIDIQAKPGRGTEIVMSFPAVVSRRHNPDRESLTRAAICLLDARAASMVAHILEAAGWHAVRTDTVMPGEATIWVTEPSAAALAAAKRYVLQPGRAVVALGRTLPRGPWERLGAIVVENGRDFEALRSALGKAIRIATKGMTP